MAHFAKLDEANVVIEVNVVHNAELLDENNVESEQKGVEFLIAWSNGHVNWKQTSYNGNFRKNYAGIGYIYDNQRDAFIPPQPHPSWVLNEDTCRWEAPTPMPNDGKSYVWNEKTLNWEETTNG